MSENTRYVAMQHPWVYIEEEVVLVSPSMEGPLALSPPALWIWRELSTPRSLTDLYQEMASVYDDPNDLPRDEVRRHVAALVDLDLVRAARPMN